MMVIRAWAMLGVAAVAAVALQGCEGFGKKLGAPDADSATNGSGTGLDNCAGKASYVNYAEPALQSRCIACHGGSGVGTGAMRLVAGSSLTSAQLSQNYSAARAHLLDSDGGNLDINPILARPLGSLHVQIFSDALDVDYLNIRQWVADERNNPCQ